MYMHTLSCTPHAGTVLWPLYWMLTTIARMSRTGMATPPHTWQPCTITATHWKCCRSELAIEFATHCMSGGCSASCVSVGCVLLLYVHGMGALAIQWPLLQSPPLHTHMALLILLQKFDADFCICNFESKYVDELMPQNKSYTRKASAIADECICCV